MGESWDRIEAMNISQTLKTPLSRSIMWMLLSPPPITRLFSWESERERVRDNLIENVSQYSEVLNESDKCLCTHSGIDSHGIDLWDLQAGSAKRSIYEHTHLLATSIRQQRQTSGDKITNTNVHSLHTHTHFLVFSKNKVRADWCLTCNSASLSKQPWYSGRETQRHGRYHILS